MMTNKQTKAATQYKPMRSSRLQQGCSTCVWCTGPGFWASKSQEVCRYGLYRRHSGLCITSVPLLLSRDQGTCFVIPTPGSPGYLYMFLTCSQMYHVGPAQVQRLMWEGRGCASLRMRALHLCQKEDHTIGSSGNPWHGHTGQAGHHRGCYRWWRAPSRS
jgi:hypothetical protein